jgi:hypothetical protein
MHVETVVGNVELAVDEPSVVRRFRLVERHGKRLVPAQLGLRLARPESLVVRGGLGAQRREVGRLQAGPGGKVFGGGETPLFDENGLDVLAAHGREGYRNPENCRTL